jgi:peptide/nickel transport system substrate-binding protein
MRKLLPGRAWLRVAAAVAVGTVALAACGSSSPTSTPPKSSGTAVSGGTATFALPPSTTPNYIFPLTPASSFSVVSIDNLQELMFRPLYWFGGTGAQGTSPAVNANLSVGDLPVYSNGGKTVTITVKAWKFSNGSTANARGVVFWMNLLKAAVKASPANYGGYVPGLFPDNVVSYKATGPQTVVMQLKQGYSSQWFTYNELSQVFPLPAAWDVTKAGQAPGNYDQTPAGALKVYNYLSGAAKDVGSYATNPLWKIVDGPWKLAAFNSTGLAKFTYNTAYSGPAAAKHVTTFIEQPYTSDSSEFSTLAAGGTIDYGYIPAQDITQKARLASAGYDFTPWYDWGFDYAPINFNSNTLGYAFRQSYVRQAIQETYDQVADIKAFYAGYGSPTVGPVPTFPTNPDISSLEQHDPYTFSTSAAKTLLTSHGWKIISGVATCESSSACGAHVTVGTKLVINMPYASGSLSLTQELDQLKSDAAKAGIDFVLSSEPFDTVIGDTSVCKMGSPACKWEIDNWGGGWVYSPDYLPTGEELFQTAASANYGSYNDPTADKLIATTTTSSAASGMFAYENYLVKSIPVLYQPNPAYALSEISTKLGGVTQESTLNVTPEFWYLTK